MPMSAACSPVASPPCRAGSVACDCGDSDGGPPSCRRIDETRSTNSFERGSSRVKRKSSPGSPRKASGLYETTRPSPRTSGWPPASVTSKRRIVPCGRECVPRRRMPVREIVSTSFSRNSSSLCQGRGMRIAIAVRTSVIGPERTASRAHVIGIPP